MTAADEIADFYVHTASVRTLKGRGASGKTYDAAVDVPCFARIKRHVVRGADGQEVIAESTVQAAPEWYATLAPNSEVTVNGRPSTVITVMLAASGDLDLPDHCLASLT